MNKINLVDELVSFVQGFNPGCFFHKSSEPGKIVDDEGKTLGILERYVFCNSGFVFAKENTTGDKFCEIIRKKEGDHFAHIICLNPKTTDEFTFDKTNSLIFKKLPPEFSGYIITNLFFRHSKNLYALRELLAGDLKIENIDNRPFIRSLQDKFRLDVFMAVGPLADSILIDKSFRSYIWGEAKYISVKENNKYCHASGFLSWFKLG